MTLYEPMEPGWYPCTTKAFGFIVVEIEKMGSLLVLYPDGLRRQPWEFDVFCETFNPIFGPRIEEWMSVEE